MSAWAPSQPLALSHAKLYAREPDAPSLSFPPLLSSTHTAADAGFSGRFTDAQLAQLDRCLASSILHKELDAQVGWGGAGTAGAGTDMRTVCWEFDA